MLNFMVLSGEIYDLHFIIARSLKGFASMACGIAWLSYFNFTHTHTYTYTRTRTVRTDASNKNKNSLNVIVGQYLSLLPMSFFNTHKFGLQWYAYLTFGHPKSYMQKQWPKKTIPLIGFSVLWAQTEHTLTRNKVAALTSRLSSRETL